MVPNSATHHIWPVKPLPAKKSLNFLLTRCTLPSLVYPGRDVE